MAFDPGLQIGNEISNKELRTRFKCSNSGGMRKSNRNNVLVIVSDSTKGFYHDKWIDGVLHYTGMGKEGDQDINYRQNRTLSNSRENGVDIFLFEVLERGRYIYRGKVELVMDPYQEEQLDKDGNRRYVWMFPVRPINNVNDIQEQKK